MSLLEASRDFKNLAPTLRKFLAIADELERIGSIDQAAGEAQARLDKIRGDHDAVGQDIDRRRAEADAEIRSRQEAAELQFADARREADEVSRRIVDLRGELEELGRQVGAARAEHDSVAKAHQDFLSKVLPAR